MMDSTLRAFRPRRPVSNTATHVTGTTARMLMNNGPMDAERKGAISNIASPDQYRARDKAPMDDVLLTGECYWHMRPPKERAASRLPGTRGNRLVRSRHLASSAPGALSEADRVLPAVSLLLPSRRCAQTACGGLCAHRVLLARAPGLRDIARGLSPLTSCCAESLRYMYPFSGPACLRRGVHRPPGTRTRANTVARKFACVPLTWARET